ncbi:hypothetical protein HMPREF9441_02576 [Paraprevotella clara YIT 11840]|uniref:Uncharacterized protein n=1 Tax=Paraprevotella clara YIT 11840 TaxID=762968 RepID=G5ST75_9BACT|nr:hypothetical protein HMPREF9441_02576 [Paraprevotella clara YIT 11840]
MALPHFFSSLAPAYGRMLNIQDSPFFLPLPTRVFIKNCHTITYHSPYIPKSIG